jgi:hypothetical protein
MFDNFPAWLQAVAAIAQVAFAVAMYRITKTYVHATKEIAASTAAQVELLRAGRSTDKAQSDARTELAQRAGILLASLDTMPAPGQQQIADRMMRDATMFAEEDLQSLASASARIGQATASTAATAIQDLRWVRDRANEVRGTPQSLGYDWSRFRWDRWAQHYVGARNALNTLRAS